MSEVCIGAIQDRGSDAGGAYRVMCYGCSWTFAVPDDVPDPVPSPLVAFYSHVRVTHLDLWERIRVPTSEWRDTSEAGVYQLWLQEPLEVEAYE